MQQELERVKKRTGYEVIFFQGSEDGRAEIISVDKVTIVEDIQKYIDLNLNHKKITNNTEEVIKTQ